MFGAYFQVDSDKPNNHFNDGKCDETGRLWGGTRGPGLPNGDIETEKGSLYSFDKKGDYLKPLNDRRRDAHFTHSSEATIAPNMPNLIRRS